MCWVCQGFSIAVWICVELMCETRRDLKEDGKVENGESGERKNPKVSHRVKNSRTGILISSWKFFFLAVLLCFPFLFELG